jgi:hypothetical protein
MYETQATVILEIHIYYIQVQWLDFARSYLLISDSVSKYYKELYLTGTPISPNNGMGTQNKQKLSHS